MSARESGAEEEDVGPSVDSNDTEERIAARRNRISRRVEAERRAARGDDDDKKVEVKELTKSRKQMEASRQRLTKLKTDGTELVTNIRVAGDAREATRRVEEEEVKRQRKDKLDAESKAGADRFDEITKKWDQALQKEIPQDLHEYMVDRATKKPKTKYPHPAKLHEMLMQQKAACDAMIDEKNKLITEFQTELKQKDDLYVKDLKKQAEDIDLMIERMEEQIKQLTKAYREELNEIEAAFLAERRELLDANRKRWEGQMQSRRDKEVDAMENREKRVEDYEKQLQNLRVQDAEEYNIVKIKLETDVQILEQQLQQMRATYQLNQEKLEYNFQVLKKRDEENTITKSQQKRKITRMQDVLNNSKIKLAKQEKQYKDENNALMDDYKRITEQFKELQKKSKHFMSTDARKFHDVWLMNEAEAKDLVKKVMEEDRLIHEHQLGLAWTPPDLSFLENVGPLVDDSASKHGLPANEVVKEVISQTSQLEGQEDPLEQPRSEILQKVSAHTVKRILELICDESGFLVEAKLKKLLSPLEKDERSLMGLDAIFSALGVDTEEDIQKLVQYFMIHETTMKPAASQQSLAQSEKSERTDAASEETDISPRSSVPEHTQLIHPNDVVKALRSFVNDHKQPQKETKKASVGFRITADEERDTSRDSDYWKNYATVLTPEKEKLWDALLEGLEKYSDVLNNRANLITETDALRQQNAELRMLLHQYVNSKVNQQLEIPPTRLLHMQLSQM